MTASAPPIDRPQSNERRRARRRRGLRCGLGAALWAAAASGIAALVHEPSGAELRSLRQAASWLLHLPLTIELRFPEDVDARPGDPLFLRAGASGFAMVGLVSETRRADGAPAAPGDPIRALRCELYGAGHPELDSGCRATLINVPQTAAWVFRTLLPRERLLALAGEWNRTLLEHREEVFQAIAPVLQGFSADLIELLQADLPPAIEGRAAALGALGRRFQEDPLQKELLPLFEVELFPLLVRRAQPTLDELGREIYAQLPLWSLAWRFAYGALPWTADSVVAERWQQFVDEEVLPIVRSHLDDLFGVFQDVALEAGRNPTVAAALRRALGRIASDAELHHELRLLFERTILDNPRFHDAVLRRWQSPDMDRAVERLAVFIGPLLARWSDAILGTRGGGITPEFARVLRTQILEKDRRWILLEPGARPAPPLADGQVLEARVEGGG